jgi:hypothetical protein
MGSLHLGRSPRTASVINAVLSRAVAAAPFLVTPLVPDRTTCRGPATQQQRTAGHRLSRSTTLFLDPMHPMNPMNLNHLGLYPYGNPVHPVHPVNPVRLHRFHRMNHFHRIQVEGLLPSGSMA